MEMNIVYVCALTVILISQVGQGQSQGQGQNSGPLVYSMTEELAEDVTLGNIIVGTGLISRYTQDVLRSFQYDVLPGDYKAYYKVVKTSWGKVDLKTSSIPLDRDSLCPQMLECVIRLDIAVVRPTDYFQVFQAEITVTDKNDNSPMFPQEQLTMDVSEGAVPGHTQFVLPSAYDPDSGVFGVQTYTFSSESNKFQLQINNNTDGSMDLRLKLVEQLDRESMESYRMQVTAYDGELSGPRNSGTLEIIINVEDSNDNSPIFSEEQYEVTIREDASLRTPIVQVHATDQDIGLNGEIVYGFSQQTLSAHGHTFEINNVTGAIYPITALDYEKRDSYNLIVTAKDRGSSSIPAHAKVIVTILDVNDHPPRISINALTGADHAEIMENGKVGTFVAQVKVQDQDKGPSGRVECEIHDSSKRNFGMEKIYDKMFKVVTKQVYDREQVGQYDVAIKCWDHGNPPLTATQSFVVRIADDNDNTPVFVQHNYTQSIRENNTIGQPILRVNATDRDIGRNGRVSYHLDTNAQTMLDIDPSSGVISTKAVFDHEAMTSFSFKVIASDNGNVSRFTSTNVRLNIIDINDEAPIFTQETYNFGTYEGQVNGTEIGTVNAVDPDNAPYNTFTYSLDASRSDVSTFEIDSQTGRITTKRILDREHQSAYYLVVIARDTVFPHPSSSASITVYVADKNDNAPMILFPNNINDTVEVSSYAPRGHTFTKIIAKDADLGNNARLTFSIGKGNENDVFDIDPATGVLSVKGDLQESTRSTYFLLILVKDGGTPAKSAVASLDILINHSKEFANQNNLAQEEDDGSSILGYHQKIIIILGCVTAVMVAILATAIFCIRRKQIRQEKESYKYICRVDMAQRMASEQPPDMDGHGTLPPSYSSAVGGGSDLMNPDLMNMHDLSASTSDGSDSRLTFERSATCPRHGMDPQLSSSTGHLPQHIANQQVEVHKLLDILKTDPNGHPDAGHDSDSTSGCSADMSNSDSGRGTEGCPDEGGMSHSHSSSSSTFSPTSHHPPTTHPRHHVYYPPGAHQQQKMNSLSRPSPQGHNSLSRGIPQGYNYPSNSLPAHRAATSMGSYKDNVGSAPPGQPMSPNRGRQPPIPPERKHKPGPPATPTRTDSQNSMTISSPNNSAKDNSNNSMPKRQKLVTFASSPEHVKDKARSSSPAPPPLQPRAKSRDNNGTPCVQLGDNTLRSVEV